MSTITTTELSEGLDDPRRTVVDIRPLASYNGWRRNGEARGGHIPGAVAFPAGWLRIVDEAEIRRLLDEKGITADREVVVYGDGPDDAAAFAAALADLGIPGARTSRVGPRPGPPIRRCRSIGSRTTSSSSTSRGCATFSTGETPEAPPNEEFLLFHVNFGVPEEYAEGHIPGALFLDTNWLEDPADWNRRSPEVIERPSGRSASPATRRSSSTAATPRATPTRSGRAVGPARSPPRGR